MTTFALVWMFTIWFFMVVGYAAYTQVRDRRKRRKKALDMSETIVQTRYTMLVKCYRF